jgi:hypothetical protein
MIFVEDNDPRGYGIVGSYKESACVIHFSIKERFEGGGESERWFLGGGSG